MYVCVYVLTYVFMSLIVCIYVCMYVCMFVYISCTKDSMHEKNVKISLLSFMYVCIHSYDSYVKLLNCNTYLAILGSQLYARRPDGFGPIERVHKRKDSWVPQQSYRLWCSWFPHR